MSHGQESTPRMVPSVKEMNEDWTKARPEYRLYGFHIAGSYFTKDIEFAALAKANNAVIVKLYELVPD